MRNIIFFKKHFRKLIQSIIPYEPRTLDWCIEYNWLEFGSGMYRWLLDWLWLGKWHPIKQSSNSGRSKIDRFDSLFFWFFLNFLNIFLKYFLIFFEFFEYFSEIFWIFPEYFLNIFWIFRQSLVVVLNQSIAGGGGLGGAALLEHDSVLWTQRYGNALFSLTIAHISRQILFFFLIRCHSSCRGSIPLPELDRYGRRRHWRFHGSHGEWQALLPGPALQHCPQFHDREHSETHWKRFVRLFYTILSFFLSF